MNRTIENIFDKDIISDVRYKLDNKKLIVWSKRSKYKVTIPTTVDKKIAYLAGVIVGDGNVVISKRKETKYPRTRILIFNASREYLEFLNDEFYSTFNIKGKIYKKKDKNCYVLAMNKKLIVLYFLKTIGLMSGKKDNLKIPISLIDKNLFKYFVAGLYDTDGFFYETFGIMMSGSNYEFLKTLSELLKKYYDISSRKLYFGKIITQTGLKLRAQTQIRTQDIEKFINTIPLKHSKYGPVV